MKPAGIIGIILIVAGIVMLAYGGFASFTTKENVAKLGPLEINQEQEHRVPVGPIVGGVALVGGIILLVAGTKKG
jgi:drug/metabolite transporter (DMT)-like permease